MSKLTTPVADGKEWDAFFAKRDAELKEMYGESMAPPPSNADKYVKVLVAVFLFGVWLAFKAM